MLLVAVEDRVGDEDGIGLVLLAGDRALGADGTEARNKDEELHGCSVKACREK